VFGHWNELILLTEILDVSHLDAEDGTTHGQYNIFDVVVGVK